jgi:beta-glucanase (GH16 family)
MGDNIKKICNNILMSECLNSLIPLVDLRQDILDPNMMLYDVTKVSNESKQFKRHKYLKPLAIVFAGLTMAGCSTNAHPSHMKTGDTTSKFTAPIKSPELTTPPTAPGPSQPNTLFSQYPTWSQNFATDKNKTLNSKYWNVYQGAPPSNNEAEFYTNNSVNLQIAKGALNLIARQQKVTNNYNYTSARIDTAGKKDFLYGKFEITAQLPDVVPGQWPAIWLYPDNTKYTDMSPLSDPSRIYNGGEIDIAEAVGVYPNLVYGIVHNLAAQNNPGGEGFFNTQKVIGNNNTYNTYGVEWTPTSITFTINNKSYYTYDKQAGANYTNWPFNTHFYLILDLALGGSWGGIDRAQFPPNGIAGNAVPADMKVKSIYYYSYIGNTTKKN